MPRSLRKVYPSLGKRTYDAICNGDIKSIEKAIKHNANAKDNHDNTILHYVCECENVEILKMLMDNKVNANAVNSTGNTPLHIACINYHAETVKILVDNGADVNAVNSEGDTPLHIACVNSDIETAKILVDNGANVNTVNSTGNTPFHITFKTKCVGTFNTLLYARSRKQNIVDIQYILDKCENDEFLDVVERYVIKIYNGQKSLKCFNPSNDQVKNP
jgi:hypothetical protein